MASAPFICVVLPAFNEGVRLPGFLAELVEHLGASKGPRFQFVVVDDGSTPDDAAAYVEAVDAMKAGLAKKDKGHLVELVHADRNMGKAAAIRFGWSRAAQECDWWSFLDADGAVSAPEFYRLAH